MAVTTGGNLPLYLHVAQRILRDLRVDQQSAGTGFNYTGFKRMLALGDYKTCCSGRQNLGWALPPCSGVSTS